MGQILKKYSEHYSVEEWRNWQDRWELIDGFPYCMSPAPSKQHQLINSRLIQLLNNELNACKKFIATIFVDWEINEDTVVQPDVSVICNDLEGTGLNVPPKIIFEIFSPSTKQKDQGTKFNLYEANGVNYYVMVDPVKSEIEIFLLANGSYKKQESTSIFHFEINECSFDFDFSKIWN
ncbi:MAG: Uma2 family endonuclease [Bacteroidia bacterium]|nr:Uma2 family endonuclease [Bacteroidia bacterium]